MEYLNVYNEKYLKALKYRFLSLSYRLQIVDWTEDNIIKDITDKLINGSGSLRINYQQGVRRSFSFDVENSDQGISSLCEYGNFYIGTKFKLQIGVESIDKEDVFWWDQGIFIISEINNSFKDGSKIVSVQAVDKFGVLGSELGYSQLTGNYKIESGANIYDVIVDILRTDMQNGYVLDYKEPLLDPIYRNEITPYTIIKSKGNHLSDLVIELANILGCNIFYDRTGRLTLSPGTEDVSYSQSGVTHIFEEDDIEISDIEHTYDYKNVINSVTVVGTNINDKIYSYTAQNNNYFSDTRIELIGLKEAEPIESAMVSSDVRAREFATYKLNCMSILQSRIDIQTFVLPHLEVDEVIQISNNYFKFVDSKFIIQSMSFTIDYSSPMNISCCNISALPYYESN